MGKKTSIKKNFAYQMLYEILIIILPFLTSPYVSRVIGAEGIGSYSYSYSVAYYFVLVASLGIKNYGNRAVAQARDNQRQLNHVFSSIFTVRAFISIICILFYLIYIQLLNGSERIYAEIQIFYVVSALFDVSWLYFGLEQFKSTVTRNIFVKISTVICIFIFVQTSKDLWKYCMILSVGNLLSQVILWIPIKNYVAFVKTSKKDIIEHIKPMFILFIPAVAVSLYKYMDKIMLGILSSKAQLGFYENAEKVINIPSTIITAFGTVMLPKMSNLASRGGKDEAAKYISLSMEFVMCLAYALAFGLAGIGKVFSIVFWGDEFSPCGSIIMALSITIPFIAFANVIRTQYLIPNSKDKEYLFSIIIGAALNVIFNSILIPQIGSMGAVCGTILAEVSVCLIQTFTVKRELPIRGYIQKSIPFFLIGMFMFLFTYFIGHILKNHVYTVMIQVCVGGILYCTACAVYFYKKKNEVFMSCIKKYVKGRTK